MGITFALYGTEHTNHLERIIEEIPVTWPEEETNLQLSGMDWYNDYLVILPESKHLFKKTDNLDLCFYYIPKSTIVRYLLHGRDARQTKPIVPMQLKVSIKGFSNLSCLCDGQLDFEGFEALAFHRGKNFVFLAIEANINKTIMKTFLVRGTIDPISLQITVNLDQPRPLEIPSVITIPNYGYEALFVTDDKVVAIYEANGNAVNPNPTAYAYDFDLKNKMSIPFPPIDYRVTDATALDSENRFWCINYYYPDEKEKLLPPDEDMIEGSCGIRPPSRRYTKIVERLVEFRYQSSEIRYVNCSLIPLQPGGHDPKSGRNWEGIVRFQDVPSKKDGFLVVTDRYPRTLFAFIQRDGN